MGAGIAQACASGGHAVTVVDRQPEALERCGATIDASLERLLRKGSIATEAATATRERVRTSTDLAAALDGTDVVIEAVYEDLAVKQDLWRAVDEHSRPDALLATNTSSLSVTEIAQVLRHPERFCGLHFFNPVPVLPLVEVVRAEHTSATTLDEAVAFVSGIGKTPIVCGDTPGFIVNRLLIPYVNDAIHALGEGVARAVDIDTAMKLGANLPMGPLALADLIGLDVTLAVIESLHRETADPRFRPAPRLRQLVRAGKLGRKSGEGFHRYE
ncbi:MAG: 3-hydroxybutyryl-CoA dehydrogenase [Trueperaceae bacterium]|nr:3-hydroxybutyryl-CoA dehydrogenase [Trueperaceae bacterium]